MVFAVSSSERAWLPFASSTRARASARAEIESNASALAVFSSAFTARVVLTVFTRKTMTSTLAARSGRLNVRRTRRARNNCAPMSARRNNTPARTTNASAQPFVVRESLYARLRYAVFTSSSRCAAGTRVLCKYAEASVKVPRAISLLPPRNCCCAWAISPV